MISKMNQHKALWLINTALLASSLAASNVMATECGQAKLIEAGSVGVNVTKNTCQEQSRLSLTSVLEMSPGSRMWLKFDPSGGESFQVICQNKSAAIVGINIAKTTAPWINPQGLKNCDQWVNNKLNCDGQAGEKNGFFCAIASTKLVRSDTAPEVTTSIKMRSLFQPNVPVEDIINVIKPDIDLCKSLYDVSGKLEMSWAVSLGIIKDLNINSENKDLVACVEGVVKQANADQDITIRHAF